VLDQKRRKKKPELESRMKFKSIDRSCESRNQFSPALTNEEAAQLTPRILKEMKPGTRPRIETKPETI
jgi:hypothetical protein